MSHFKIDFLAEYTDDALLNELRRVATALSPGELLTKTVFDRHEPRAAHSTIRRRFGGWREALEKAGLSHLYHGQIVSEKMRRQPARTLSDDELTSEIRRVHKLIGKDWLTSDDFNTHSITSEEAVRLRFGTFRRGLELAGVPQHPFKARQFNDVQCFENLAEVWTHLGRTPGYREMFTLPSRIQGKTYVTRWGSWRKALQAFVEWTNAETDGVKVLQESEPAISFGVAAPQPRTEADCREIRPGLRFKVFQRDRFRCVACGGSPASHLSVELHADHILAVANGGKTTLENLQTLCQDCNLGKGRMVV